MGGQEGIRVGWEESICGRGEALEASEASEASELSEESPEAAAESLVANLSQIIVSTPKLFFPVF